MLIFTTGQHESQDGKCSYWKIRRIIEKKNWLRFSIILVVNVM